jgi:hypothetical protein
MHIVDINSTGDNAYKVKNEKKNSQQIIHFLICKSCFWCASCIDIKKACAITTISKCPSCNNESLKSSFVNIV